jgi:hypothetical protein
MITYCNLLLFIDSLLLTCDCHACSHDQCVISIADAALIEKYPYLTRLEQMIRIHLNGDDCRIDGRLVSVSELQPIRSKVRS